MFASPQRGTQTQTQIMESKKLREYLLSCPSMSPDSEAMAIALMTLDELVDDSQKSSSSRAKGILSPIRLMRYGNGNSSSTHRTSNDHGSSRNTTPSRSPYQKIGSIAISGVRCLFVYLPLITLFATLCLLFSLHHIQNTYISPQLKLLKFTPERRNSEMTFYSENTCTVDDITTTDVNDLLLPHNATAQESFDHMMIHGMSMYQEILSKNTSAVLREYILNRNAQLTPSETIGVIENQNRWSFGFGANDDPIVAKALNEIATHKVFAPAIEKIAGRNPAVIEFTTITAAYGAKDQFWHADTVPHASALQYAKSFAPSFGLFITLQDTTAEMGATGICPGAYRCSNNEKTFCAEHGIQASGDDVWKAGNAVLMSQHSIHRGPAHKDPNAPPRVLFIVTFTPRFTARGETRQFAHGGSYSTRWDMWGHNLNDLRDSPVAMAQPWATLRSLGIYKKKNADWGWDFVSQTMMRVANEDTGYSEWDLEQMLGKIERGELGLPSILTPKIHARTWEEFFEKVIIFLKHLTVQATLCALVFYTISAAVVCTIIMSVKVIFTSASPLSSMQDFAKSVLKTVGRIALVNGLIVLLTLSTLQHMANTGWAKDIKAGRLWRPNFGDLGGTGGQQQVTNPSDLTTVTSNDILINSHYDSNDLNDYGTQFLDYNRGNMAFNANIESSVPIFQALIDADREKLVTIVVQNTSASNHRFLEQNKSGDWIALPVKDSENYTGRILSLKQSPLANSLEKERRSLMSFYHHGHLRSTKMGTRFSPLLLDDIMDGIFKLETPGISNFDVIGQKKKMPKKANEKQSDISFTPSCHKSNVAISSVRRFVTAPTPSRIYPMVQTIPSSRQRRIVTDNHGIFKVGDVVEGRYLGHSNEWYKGHIKGIRQGSFVDILYLDGIYDFGLSLDSVKPFKAFQVGEIVEARRRGDRDTWEFAIVTKEGTINSSFVRYSTDGTEQKVNHLFVRRFIRNFEFQVGDDVDLLSGLRIFKATIIDRFVDGSISIRFHDGRTQRITDQNRIMPRAWFNGSLNKNRS